jgi:hypothetical protein
MATKTEELEKSIIKLEERIVALLKTRESRNAYQLFRIQLLLQGTERQLLSALATQPTSQPIVSSASTVECSHRREDTVKRGCCGAVARLLCGDAAKPDRYGQETTDALCRECQAQ